MTTSITSALIGLDWGTSSLRAYRFNHQGEVLERRALPWGIMQLPPASATDADSDTDSAAGFRRALEAACGDWMQAEPTTPLIAAGMIGSKQGWCEAPYLTTPLSVDAIGRTLTRVDTGSGQPLHIIPGLLQEGALPNVMRGEETQVAGMLAQIQARASAPETLLIGLPGTHSKWVRVDVREQSIRHFDTFMTGELYGALCQHTILGRTMEREGAADEAAFLRGAAVASTAQGEASVLSTIFSTRTLGLTGVLSARAQADYLSGLLIGHEIAALRKVCGGNLHDSMVLIGDDFLCQRYRQVLALHGSDQVEIAATATERGFWQLAINAGLVSQQMQ